MPIVCSAFNRAIAGGSNEAWEIGRSSLGEGLGTAKGEESFWTMKMRAQTKVNPIRLRYAKKSVASRPNTVKPVTRKEATDTSTDWTDRSDWGGRALKEESVQLGGPSVEWAELAVPQGRAESHNRSSAMEGSRTGP